MTAQRVLLVRTRADGATVRRLKRLGYEAHGLTVARIASVAFAMTPHPAGLILTSAAAVAYIPADWRHLPVYAVGVATARAAHKGGFADVRVSSGAVQALIDTICNDEKRPDGLLVHLGGERISYDVAGALNAGGIAAEHRVAYRLASRLFVPPAQAFDHILFTSQQAVEMFETVMSGAGQTAPLKSAVAHVFSTRVAQALTLSYAAVAVAESPQMESLIASVGPAPL